MARTKAHRQELLTRFLAKVDKTDHNGCWIWQGTISKAGYGYIGIDYKSIPAHRIAYELFIGTIPKGFEVDHTCFNKACVNPAHLEAVTVQENHNRWARHLGLGAIRARLIKASHVAANQRRQKTHCKWGHPFNEKNTHIRPNGNRGCRTCSRLAWRKWKENQNV